MPDLKSIDDKILIAMIAAFASLVVALINLGVSFYNNWSQIREKQKAEKRAEIYKKLNDFYGPFQQYLSNSLELYKIFRVGKPKDFRTLTYLLDPAQQYEENGKKVTVTLSDTDNKLLDEILLLETKMEDLIISKAGLVDDPVLRYKYQADQNNTDALLKNNGLLPIVKTHFQLLRLAKSGLLKGDIDKYKDYVYPRELNERIESKIAVLQNQLEELHK